MNTRVQTRLQAMKAPLKDVKVGVFDIDTRFSLNFIWESRWKVRMLAPLMEFWSGLLVFLGEMASFMFLWWKLEMGRYLDSKDGFIVLNALLKVQKEGFNEVGNENWENGFLWWQSVVGSVLVEVFFFFGFKTFGKKIISVMMNWVFLFFFWLLLLVVLLFLSCFLVDWNFNWNGEKWFFSIKIRYDNVLFELFWDFLCERMISFSLFWQKKKKLEIQGSRLKGVEKTTSRCHSSRERKIALQQDVRNALS